MLVLARINSLMANSAANRKSTKHDWAQEKQTAYYIYVPEYTSIRNDQKTSLKNSRFGKLSQAFFLLKMQNKYCKTSHKYFLITYLINFLNWKTDSCQVKDHDEYLSLLKLIVIINMTLEMPFFLSTITKLLSFFYSNIDS